MSQENVEIVRGAIEAFNRRDLARLTALCDEDFEFVSLFTAVDADGATYRGASAWTEYAERMDETWDGWTIVDIRISDAGEEGVVALFRLVATGKLSGMPVQREVGAAYRLREGKLWRMRSYPEPGDAFRALGLEP
jgi:ketosteroid isomerase-like protein